MSLVDLSALGDLGISWSYSLVLKMILPGYGNIDTEKIQHYPHKEYKEDRT